MTNLESLRSLQKRIREVTGPDRDLDGAIAKALDASFSAPPYLTDAPEFTLDPDGLGPCVALMREVLPGWTRAVDATSPEDGIDVELFFDGVCKHARPKGEHALETHATLLAIVSAKIDDCLDRMVPSDLRQFLALIERQQQVIDLLMKAVEPFSGVVTYEHLCRVREAKVEADRILSPREKTDD